MKDYGNAVITPQGVVEPAGEPDIKVSADITWDELTFVYKDGDKQWNPTTHQDDTLQGGWDTTKKNITVTNHSNAGIRATISFVPTVDGIIGTFEGDTVMQLDSAVDTTRENAPKSTVQFGISGTKITDTTATKIGTLTVKVATQSGAPIYTTVADQSELQGALNAGREYIKLTDSILYASSSELLIADHCTIDLNGCTITVMAMMNRSLFQVTTGKSFCLKNGTIVFQDVCKNVTPIKLEEECTLVVENCTLNAKNATALDITKSDVCMKDSVINCSYDESSYLQVLLVRSGTLTLSGMVEINNANTPLDKWEAGTVTVLSGTYNFDVSSYVDTNQFSVTESSGTWTVTAK